MKTRIKIVELNNGNKQFVCQEDRFEFYTPVTLFIVLLMLGLCFGWEKTSFFWVMACVVMYAIATYQHGDWVSLQYELPLTLEIKTYDGIPQYAPAVYGNIEEAKKFLDEYIVKGKKLEDAKDGNKIKSVTYEKYP
jgi:hypothetical protein